MIRVTGLAAGLSAMMLALPAIADVKAGVDAWSRGEFRKAVNEWRSLAVAGDADAQFNMGQAYKLGRGVPVDKPIALEWYRKAAVQNHAQAQDNYGLMLFELGRKAEAVPWLEKSVVRDEKRAALVLGTMLFNGDGGVTKDWTRAYALVTRSSQQGLPQGSQTLAQMDQYIPAAQRQQGIALAAQYERRAQASAAALPPPGPPMRTAAVPPSTPEATAPAPKPAVKTAPTKAAPPKSIPVAATQPTRGGWRIQLGAFRDAGNAKALWAKVGARTGGSAAYVAAGGVTRLQATGFASKTAASAACAKAGVSCVVVAP